MKLLNRALATNFLTAQGINEAEVRKVLGGFDLSKPIYENAFWSNDVLYQLIRLPSALDPLPSTGNWFGLTGITTTGVAVNDGIAGRRLARFKVAAPFKALEGTAARFRIDLGMAIGGDGGATQIFIPRQLLGHLYSLGPADR